MLEISLRTAASVTVTTTPQKILPARGSGDNRVYLKLFNRGPSDVYIASDLEFSGSGFSATVSGWPVYANTESWEEPGGVPGNAFYAWTMTGTALLSIQEA